MVLAAHGARCTKPMADVRGGLGGVGCQNSLIKPIKLRDERVGEGHGARQTELQGQPRERAMGAACRSQGSRRPKGCFHLL